MPRLLQENGAFKKCALLTLFSPCLMLKIKDAGGLDALSRGEGNAAIKIDVSEKILALEKLNPTPRPTTYVVTYSLLNDLLSCA